MQIYLGLKEVLAPSRCVGGKREPAQSAGMKSQLTYRHRHVLFSALWMKSWGYFSISVLKNNSKAYLDVCVPLGSSAWNILCDTSFSEISLKQL